MRTPSSMFPSVLLCWACGDPGSSDTATGTGSSGSAASNAEASSVGEIGDDSGSDTHADTNDDGTGETPDDFPTDGFLGGFFPIGVFGQPAYAMEGWVSMGCNTMFEVPQDENLEQWDQQAQQLGLAVIRAPLGDPADDIGRTDLLAWSLPDEPDIDINQASCGGDCIELVESMSAYWRSVDASRPIFVNLAGPNVLLSDSCDFCNGPGDDAPAACVPDNDGCYPRILATADWVSQDIYPVTGWLPDELLREDVTVVGRTLDKLRGWTDKPLFAILEISDQRLGFDGTGVRGPTRDEYRAELWHAIIHGARGVFYFPQAFNPFDFESVAPELLEELAIQHARITALAPLLQGEADPDQIAIAVDAPLEATWRLTEHHAWLFVLNTSDQPGEASIRVDGVEGSADVYDEARSVALDDDALIDRFEPYALHVYALRRA